MLLREEDSSIFKRWLLPKLETISDADAEVLADYVIALVTADESEASIRHNCVDSLVDFLQDNTASFVDDVVLALKSKSYISRTFTNESKQPSASVREQHIPASQAGPIPSIVGTSNSEYEPHPSHSTYTPPLHAPKGPAASRAPTAQHRLPDRPTGPLPLQSNSPGLRTQQDRDQSSRKRKLKQRDASETREGQDAQYGRPGAGIRPTKQAARRGGKNLRGSAAVFEPQNGVAGFAPMPNMLNMANLPPPPPGPVPFDMNNPMAFFAMMAALGTGMPGMPPLPLITPQDKDTNGQARRGKCQDYHMKGFCAGGSLCPFEHGDTVSGYDPDQPSFGTHPVTFPNIRQSVNRTYRNGATGGRARAPFSLPGPTHDRTNTTVVVEQIPKEHFSEDNVRTFFSEFGTITDVKLHAYKRLAIVTYEEYSAANQAYNSPKAVFENRFVKVYWCKPDTVVGMLRGGLDDVDMANVEEVYDAEEEALDPEEIERRQAEAQKAFEERRRKIEETEAKAVEIERQLKEKDAEMRHIRQQLAELAGTETNGVAKEELSQELATLQAEAENLFVKTDFEPPATRGRGIPPRGDHRGRGFATAPFRGRGTPRGAYRSAYPGRGAFTTPFTRNKSSVKRLDNRPRCLAVAGIEKGTQKDEALRQYLVNVPECTSIEQHPEQPHMLILAFQERYQAEIFLDNSLKIPDTGPLELSWVPNDALDGLTSTTTTTINDVEAETDVADDDSSATIGEQENEDEDKEREENGQAADADMDVADDVDRWL